MRKEQGYSLIELIGVTAILAIVVVIAVPNLSKANRAYQLNATAQQIAQHLQAAKQDALGKNTTRRIQLNTNNQSMTASSGTPIEFPTTVHIEALPSDIPAPALIQNAALNTDALAFQEGNPRASLSLPEGTVAGVHELAFNAKGLPAVDPGVLHWMYLTNQDGQRVAITISSAGSTSILTWRGGEWR